jgi:hypothetical protein
MTTITTNELLDTSLAQLRTLAAFLREQLGEGGVSLTSDAPQLRACRDVLGSLSLLILRLQAAREAFAGAGEPEHAGLHRHDRLQVPGTV